MFLRARLAGGVLPGKRLRHTGHSFLGWSFQYFSKQCRQKLWLQFSTTGSVKKSQHTGHCRSSSRDEGLKAIAEQRNKPRQDGRKPGTGRSNAAARTVSLLFPCKLPDLCTKHCCTLPYLTKSLSCWVSPSPSIARKPHPVDSPPPDRNHTSKF